MSVYFVFESLCSQEGPVHKEGWKESGRLSQQGIHSWADWQQAELLSLFKAELRQILKFPNFAIEGAIF